MSVELAGEMAFRQNEIEMTNGRRDWFGIESERRDFGLYLGGNGDVNLVHVKMQKREQL